jgi:hypothetical protein
MKRQELTVVAKASAARWPVASLPPMQFAGVHAPRVAHALPCPAQSSSLLEQRCWFCHENSLRSCHPLGLLRSGRV